MDIEDILAEFEKTLELGLLYFFQSVFSLLCSTLLIARGIGVVLLELQLQFGVSGSLVGLLSILFIFLIFGVVAFINSSRWLYLQFLLLLLLHLSVASWAESLHQPTRGFRSGSPSF